MFTMSIKRRLVVSALAVAALLMLPLGSPLLAAETPTKDKVKVLYHVDGKDLEVAKYAMALINKHIDAEGGPDKIDVELVVHGPGLRPFIARTIDPDVKGKVETLLTGGMAMGACQITMKRQSIKPEELIDGLVPIPSGVVRVMELEEKGYAYIRP